MGRLTNWIPMVVIAALLSGCADGATSGVADGDPAAATDKAGGSAGTVVLEMGTDGGPGRPDADQVLYFAEQVDERSDGRIRIEPLWDVGGDEKDTDPVDYPGWDQLVARAVVAGELDLALVPARAWDTEGVTSLRPLNAPLLLTSEKLVAGAVTSDLADEMLAGLDDVGVVGLGLPPEGMRRLFAFGDPPASATPWAGGIVRAPRSATTYAFLAALGGEPDDLPGGGTDRFLAGVRDGSVVAAESSFALAGTLPDAVAALGGPPLFPKVNTLVANVDVFRSLTEADQQVLRDAAADTVSWAIETMPDEAEDARAFCERSRITAGIPSDVLEEAAAKVEGDLRDDPDTASLIDAIRDLAADVGATTPSIEPCEPSDEQTDGAATGADRGAFPDGVYRLEHATEELVAAGVDEPTAAEHAGIWTMWFDDGRLVTESTNEHSGEQIIDEGVYCAEGARVIVGIEAFGDPPTCGNFWSAAWELDGAQLRLSDLETPLGDDYLLEPLFAGKPWQRIE